MSFSKYLLLLASRKANPGSLYRRCLHCSRITLNSGKIEELKTLTTEDYARGSTGLPLLNLKSSNDFNNTKEANDISNDVDTFKLDTERQDIDETEIMNFDKLTQFIRDAYNKSEKTANANANANSTAKATANTTANAAAVAGVKSRVDTDTSGTFANNSTGSGSKQLNVDSLFAEYEAHYTNSDSLASARGYKDSLRVQGTTLKVYEELESKSKDALRPTLDFIDNELKNSCEVNEYYLSLLKNASVQIDKARDKRNLNEQVYLRLVLALDRKQWSDKHQAVVDQIAKQNLLSPKDPVLNAISLPIITNHIFKILGFRFFNGELLMSLFHLLKENVYLHTLCCNQETYNQVLKICWIYYGSVDLLHFEKVFVEMKFMGFPGDVSTCNILKVVIDQYNAMARGKSVLNKFGARVFTKDDNARIDFFTREFEAQRLKIIESRTLDSTVANTRARSLDFLHGNDVRKQTYT